MGIKNTLCAIALATTTILGIETAQAEETTQLTTETLVFDDLSSDTRVEVDHDSLEAAVEHKTDDDYDSHKTELGVRVNLIDDLQLRQTGFVQYGADHDGDGEATEGAFNTNLFYTFGKSGIRLGAGGGAKFPDQDWIAHGNLAYFGDMLNVVADVLHHENGWQPVDGRGYASILLPNGFYLSGGKKEGPNLFGIIGYVGGKDEFNAIIRNWGNWEEQSSRHLATLSWNSAKDRGFNEFQNNFWTGPDGAWDLMDGAYDPTIGWAPMLSHHGEFGLQAGFAQNPSSIGGNVLFAYNPENKGNFVELGAGYARDLNTDDNDVPVTMNLGADLGAVYAITSGTVEVTEGDWNLWFYLGKTFDL